MRRLAWLTMVAAVVSANSGCLLNIWSGDKIRRSHELMVVSEDLRTIQEEWERIWFTDQPSHLNPFVVHGGIP